MSSQRDIMLLEASLMKDSHFRGLTYEQWTAHYAVRFRDKVNEILKKDGKLPTKEEMEVHLSQ